uniref:Ribosomal RNA small subunit methyltransferase G n=1 Tax=candidate division WOR-3 bacterium TaxID=2052148 RepID=A0A7C4GGK8_UNCW3
MTPEFPAFAAACSQLNLALTEEGFLLLRRYADLLLDWNQRINLVSRKDTDRILSYHVVDSLAAAQLVPAGAHCSDIGTGAGLPGIPLAIVRPDIRMTLVESIKKKCLFLNHCRNELHLGSVEVVCDRAESLPPLDCDTVLSRLTGPLRRTLSHLARHTRPGGTIVLYKNPDAAEELPGSLLQKLDLTITRTLDLVLPLTPIPRRFLVLLHG